MMTKTPHTATRTVRAICPVLRGSAGWAIGLAIAWGTGMAQAQPAASPPAVSEAPPLGPRVGSVAPEVSLTDLTGKTTSLTELRATGPVVLIFLRGNPGSPCPACTAQYSSFASNAKAFQDRGARVVFVFPGPEAELTAKAEQLVATPGMPEPLQVVTDPDYSLTKAYGLRWDAPGETAYPATLVIDASGRVTYAKVSQTHRGRTDAKEVLAVIPAR